MQRDPRDPIASARRRVGHSHHEERRLLKPRMPSRTGRRIERAALPRSGALFGSLALHAALLTGGAVFAGAQFAAAPRAPVAFAVLESQPSHDAPAAAPDRPPCEVHAEPCEQENVVMPCAAMAEPALVPEPAADREPPPRAPHELLATRRVVPPVAKAEPKPDPAPPQPEPAPTDAPTPPSAGASVAQPEVLVPMPGENPSPDYPDGARRRGIEGLVLVRIDVDVTGTAVACTVLTSSGNVLLDDAALRAARRWRFRSGPGVVEQPFRFELTMARAKG